jgi:hypothetical protein
MLSLVAFSLAASFVESDIRHIKKHIVMYRITQRLLKDILSFRDVLASV